MKNLKKSLPALLGLALMFTACSKDDSSPNQPVNPNEEELITTVELHFTNLADTTQTSVFAFRDPDGPGGSTPVQFDTLMLQAGAQYRVNILLLDESGSAVEDITEEVEEEGADHQFFFTYTAPVSDIVYDDTDVNGDPIGLTTLWTTGVAGSGTVLLELKHQPGVKAPAPGNPNVGDTDISLTWQVQAL